MNFEQKLNIVINEITSVYNLSNDQANLIKNNIITRVKMYKNVHPDFTSDETKIIANSSDIGDFFINRLVTNIRNYDFDQTYNKDNTLKGAYTSKEQSLYVGNYKFIEDITLDKLQNRINNVDSETLRKASLNVLNHELGHALQTSFKGKYGNNDNKYMQLINNLSTKYPSDFKLQATDEILSPIQEGMKATRKDDKSKDAREFYAKNAYTTHIDEIFNEDEALRVTGANQPQFSYDMGNGFSKNIYNYQSSNYKITSYGRMMKIVMGEDLTFKAMYEDSILAYEFFDQFKDISDKIYQGKPPMFNILDSLNKIKSESSLNESLKLDLFLTTCLQRRVAHDLKNPNLTQYDINMIKNYISEFNSQMTKNPNLVTQQDQIISNISNMVNEREKQLGVVDLNSNINKINTNNSQVNTSLYRHPKANKLNEIERKKQIAKQNNDISLYQQLQKEIENIIRTNRAERSPQQWNVMNIEERKSFIQTKMMEAKVLKDEDDFNYWNANLNSLNSEVQVESEVKHSSYTASTQEQPKNEYQQINQELEVTKDYNYYFNEMLKAVQRYNPNEQMTEDEKKQLIGEIFYNEGYLIESLTNDEEIRQVMTRSVNELSNNEMQVRLQNIILTEMQEKYKQLHPEIKKQEETIQNEVKGNNSHNANNDNLDLSGLIEQLRNELTKVQKAYHSMMSDGYIDDEELATLISMNNKIINDGYSLKELATDSSDLRKINVIVSSLEEQQKKMNTMLNGIEEIGRTMK